MLSDVSVGMYLISVRQINVYYPTNLVMKQPLVALEEDKI